MKEDSEQIASLISSLNHPDKKVIRQAADSLISMALHRPEVIQRLNDLLSEAPEGSRWPIAYVLAQIGSPSSACLHVLKEALDTRDPDIRWAVGLLLVRLGKSHVDVVALMLDLLKTGTATQRRMALYCLRDVGPEDKSFQQALLESLRDADPLVRVAAVTSLKFLPKIGKDGLDFLLHLFLSDPDSRVRRTAALSLAQLGAPSEEIRAALKDASRSDDPQLKKAATAALDLVEKKGPTLPE